MMSTRRDQVVDVGLRRRDSRWGALRTLPHSRSARTTDVETAQADMRRLSFESAVRRTGGRFSVVVYALTTAGNMPESSLDRAEQYARSCGWRVVQKIYDDCGMTEPTQRPGWREVLSLIRGASAQGVVTVDSSSVSSAPGEYEGELRWLLEHLSFLAHVPGDWRAP